MTSSTLAYPMCLRKGTALAPAAELLVVGLCVTYQPDMRRLGEVLRAVRAQVDEVWVLDNSPDSADQEQVAATTAAVTAHYTGLGGNVGLAMAYNRGIELARQVGASHVLLLDQDSIAGPTMVADLLAGQVAAAAALAAPVYTVGPGYKDELSGRRSAVLQSGRWSMRRARRAPTAWQTTEMLISSGSLVPLTAIDALGGFDEGLFIDHIDTDWALRVVHAHGHLVVVHGAAMSHRLGDAVQRLWWGRYRTLPVHNPVRLYYIFRNSLLLFRRPHAHWRWIVFDVQRLAVVAAVHMLAPGPRGARLVMLLRGLRDGVRGRSGPLSA